eukprot:1156186-Pelagomonas_calceolata.AAC.11
MMHTMGNMSRTAHNDAHNGQHGWGRGLLELPDKTYELMSSIEPPTEGNACVLQIACPCASGPANTPPTHTTPYTSLRI